MKRKRLWGVLALCVGLGCGAGSARAAVAVDFAREATNRWTVSPVPPAGVRVAEDGLSVRFERARLRNPTAAWGELRPVAARRPALVPGRVRLTLRIPEGGLVRAPGSLRVLDAEGEVFRFTPIETTRLGDRVLAVYNVVEGGQAGAFYGGRPKAGSTEGRKRNERFDGQLHLLGITFTFAADATAGEIGFVRLEAEGTADGGAVTARAPLLALRPGWDRFVGNGVDLTPEDGRLGVRTTRTCTSLRYASFPGMKPFPSTCDIVVRTSTNAAGPVVLNLVDPATETRVRLRAPWRTETHFTTNLPPGRTWQIRSLEFWQPRRKDGTGGQLDFALTGIEGVWRTDGAGACRLDVETGNALHLVRGPHERPVLTLRNLAETPQRWRGVLRCRDFFGKGFDRAVDERVAPGATVRLPLDWPLAKGLWRVMGEIEGEDGSRAFPETRFAVLDAHPRTPRLARGAVFRPGINWHAGRFPEGVRALTADALEACGCKLARAGGFSFAAVMPREGTYDWTTADAIMAEAEARGISLDANVYGAPRWAQDTNRLARVGGHFKAHLVPPRPGTFGAFAERIAARYGTRIDYYELGNEWDLVPERIMTRDEAVRLHREGYAGLRRGNPAVAVMSNGWTSPTVRPDHYGPDWMLGEGFLADVMTRVRDCCDYFPIHMHGPFPSYRRRVQTFLDLRRRIGCDGIPWFSNETALSSVNGQEAAVARDVYRKILYAWANGSVDYIWYNLRATGWVASDPEQGYGLLTADFHPRAGYAAFSALTSVYLGLAYDATLIDRATRLAYRFAGTRDGVRECVLGGWDDAAVEPCRIRVRTDAARAEQVDLMGNRRAVPVRDGETAWEISSWPSSLVLTGATRAEPVAEDLAAIPVRPGSVVAVPADTPGRAPDFELKAADRVHDLHQAIPDLRHRVWKGPDDLSARIWFARTGDDVTVRLEVRDDVHAAGDGATLTWQVPGGEVRTMAFPSAQREGTTDRYALTLRGAEAGFDAARLATGVFFSVQVRDDDGEGPDGWIALTDETEPLKLLTFR